MIPEAEEVNMKALVYHKGLVKSYPLNDNYKFEHINIEASCTETFFFRVYRNVTFIYCLFSWIFLEYVLLIRFNKLMPLHRAPAYVK